MLTLFAAKGCGSAAIEALLELAEVKYERVDAPPWENTQNVARLRAVNPLGAVPTLLLDDGSVLSESAAIVLWLTEQHEALRPAGVSARAAFYRWTVFLAANVYAALGVGDHPERWQGDDALKAAADERVKSYWKVLEGAVPEQGKFLLGDTLSALDVYAATLSRFRPGREWIVAECPRVAAAVQRAEKDPVVARVWARNFD
jgi:GST-like protein